MSTQTLESKNLTAIAKRRTIKRALRNWTKNDLQSLAYLTLGMCRPEKTLKANYLDQIILYYLDSNTFAGMGFLKKSDFRDPAFYYTRKRLSDFVSTLPSNF